MIHDVDDLERDCSIVIGGPLYYGGGEHSKGVLAILWLPLPAVAYADEKIIRIAPFSGSVIRSGKATRGLLRGADGRTLLRFTDANFSLSTTNLTVGDTITLGDFVITRAEQPWSERRNPNWLSLPTWARPKAQKSPK